MGPAWLVLSVDGASSPSTPGAPLKESVFRGFKTDNLEPMATLHKHRGFPRFLVKIVNASPLRTICFQTSISLGFALSPCAESMMVLGIDAFEYTTVLCSMHLQGTSF